ncbi:MAG TPA: PAS domain-containing protein [Candidatus Desulfovibrio gallistercoris]|nr:PAS domain-containing protein [Candidatus Desulfovibrio gallistercoris]
MKPIIFSEDIKKVLDMVPIAIVEISFGEGITRDANNANNAFYALTGSTREQYMEEELSGNPRNILHPDDLVPVFEAFKTHAEQKTNFDIQYRVIHMDGSTVWLDVHAAYMGTNDGKATFLCTMQVITKEKRNHAKLRYYVLRDAAFKSMTENIYMEYNLATDCIIFSGKWNTIMHNNTFTRVLDSNLEDFHFLPEKSKKYFFSILQRKSYTQNMQKSSSIKFLTKRNEEIVYSAKSVHISPSFILAVFSPQKYIEQI